MRKFTFIFTHIVLLLVFNGIIINQYAQSLIPAITRETFGDLRWDTETTAENPAPHQSEGYPYHWDFDDVTTFTAINGHWIAGSDSSIRINEYVDGQEDEVTQCSEGMHLHITMPDQYSGSWDTVILADVQINGYYDFELEFGYAKRPGTNYSIHRGLAVDVRVDDGSWITLDTTYIPYGIEEGIWYCISIPMTGIPAGNEMDIRFSTVHNHIGLDNVTLRGTIDNYWEAATGHIHLDLQNLNLWSVSSVNDCSGDLYLAWDNDYLYGMADIKDDIIGSKGLSNWYDNDAITLTFDLVPKTHSSDLAGEPWDNWDIIQIAFTAESGFAAEKNGTDNTIVNRTYNDEGYIIEFAIPLDEIKNTAVEPNEVFSPVLGNQIGFSFEINDQDLGDTRDGTLVWGHKPINMDFWRDIDQCGSMILIQNSQVRISENNVADEDAVIYKLPAGYSPVIDGIIDGVWEDMDLYYNELSIFEGISSPDISTWKAAWDDEGLYILITVDDDELCDQWCTGFADWQSDRMEVFIDVYTENLKDGRSANNITYGPWYGHYQFVTPWTEGTQSDFIDDFEMWPKYVTYDCGFVRKGDSWVYEMYIPYTSLTIDSIPGAIGPLEPANDVVIGFTMTNVDVDISEGLQGGMPIRKFSGWKECEGWTNMDYAGEVRFSSQSLDYPHATLYKFPEGCAPLIDGTVDEVWDDVEEQEINRFFSSEIPTLNSATWRAAWTNEYIIVLVAVEDDDFYPNYEAGSDVEWLYDRPEIYIDVNASLNDEGGVYTAAGHYQATFSFVQDNDQYYSNGMLWGEGNNRSGNVLYGYTVNASDYIFEYAISISSLIDNTGSVLDPYTVDVIGFDVTVTDRDEGDEDRRRAVWKNTGLKGESYINMDYCGDVALSTSTVTTSVEPLSVSITSASSTACPGTGIQLTAVPDGQAESYTYSWTSQPAGFTSTLSNPVPAPIVTTTYTVEISDGMNTATASKTIYPETAPDKPEIRLKGKDILICLDSGLYSYEWYYEDVVLAGENKQFCRINASLGGNYYVITGLENGCKTKSDAYVKVASADAPEQGEIAVQVYPVPNTGNFSLTVLGDQAGKVYLNIRDFSGQIIKNMIIDKTNSPLYKEFYLENINKGLYFIEILFDKKTYYKKVLIE